MADADKSRKTQALAAQQRRAATVKKQPTQVTTPNPNRGVVPPPNPPKNIAHIHYPAPVIKLERIQEITTYEVQESELVELDRASGLESLSLAFACGSFGALVSAAASWASISEVTPFQFAGFLATTIVLTMATVFFGILWYRERNRKTNILTRMREKTV